MSVLNVEHEARGPRTIRVVGRLLAATVVTLVTTALAALLWLLGRAQYINDYCTVRAPQPPVVMGGRSAYMSDPITVACEFDGYPTVYVTEPGLLIGALLLTAIVITVGILIIRWARRCGPAAAA